MVFRSCAMAALVALSWGCATDIESYVSRGEAATLRPGTGSKAFRLPQAVSLDVAVGIPVTYPYGPSTWKPVGTTPHGTVYRCVDDVLTVGSGHSEEAYMVRSKTGIVGLYLPVHGVYFPLCAPVPIAKRASR